MDLAIKKLNKIKKKEDVEKEERNQYFMFLQLYFFKHNFYSMNDFAMQTLSFQIFSL